MANNDKISRVEALMHKSLAGFSIQPYTEVYKNDVDGRKLDVLGYFKDKDIAIAYANTQTDAAYHGTKSVMLLTDGKIAFLLGEEVTLSDDEQASLEVRQAALKKLTPAERKVLGL